MDLLDYSKLPAAETLSKAEIEKLLPLAQALGKWASSIIDFASDQAVKGEKFTGYKLVEGRAYKQWANPDEAKTIINVKYQVDEALLFKPREMLSPSAMEDAIGSKLMKQIIAENPGIIVKPQGKLTLVPESDKRKAVDPAQSAKEDFKDVTNKED